MSGMLKRAPIVAFIVVSGMGMPAAQTAAQASPWRRPLCVERAFVAPRGYYALATPSARPLSYSVWWYDRYGGGDFTN